MSIYQTSYFVTLPNAYTDVSDIIWWEAKMSIIANATHTGFKNLYMYIILRLHVKVHKIYSCNNVAKVS